MVHFPLYPLPERRSEGEPKESPLLPPSRAMDPSENSASLHHESPRKEGFIRTGAPRARAFENPENYGRQDEYAAYLAAE